MNTDTTSAPSSRDNTVLHKNLLETRVILTTGAISVIRRFIHYNGLNILHECFRQFIDRKRDASPSTRSDEKDMSALYESLRIVRVLLNTEVSVRKGSN